MTPLKRDSNLYCYEIALVIVLLLILLVGCSIGPPGQITPIPTMLSAAPNSEPSADQELTARSPFVRVVSIQEISKANITDHFWSSDASQIFYVDSVSQSWRVFDIQTRETSNLGKNHPRAIETAEAHQSAPDLPSNAIGFEYSPSGGRGLFLILLDPTPTPPPTIEGIYSGGRIAAELWFWEGGAVRKVGEVAWCIHRYLWSHSENTVVAVLDPIAGCGEPGSWYVDLSDNTVKPLLLGKGDPMGQVISGFSPQDDRLLYIFQNNLYLLNTDTFETIKLDILPRKFLSVSWVDDQFLLASYNDELIGEDNILFGILNIDNSEFVELITDETAPELIGLSTGGASISPDRKWIAFTVGFPYSYAINGLWLMQLDWDG